MATAPPLGDGAAPGAGDDLDLDLSTIATEQHRELIDAKTLESDLDLAFNLQLQEAITASLALHPSTSSAPSPPPPTELPIPSSSNDAVQSFADLQAVELEKFQQEFKDRMISDAEFRKMRDDFSRLIHDQWLAREIQEMPDDDWEEYGDNFELPYGEGCSKNVNSEIFKVYFKGLVSDERVRDSKVKLAGIGVAICDSRNQLIFELKKPLMGPGLGRVFSEASALIEGLNAAIALDLRKLVFYCDYYPIYQFVTGRWPPKQRKIATLMNQVSVLQKKFTCCNPSLVPRNDIKFAFKLARDAIVSQINGPEESSGSRNMDETCVICLEDTDVSQMFSLDGCFHRYCFSCMKQHVEVKLLHGMVPKCPHEGCNTELEIDSCRKFLTPKLTELMKQRIKEASIPVTEKVYCPYPKCSALMSKTEVHEYTKGTLPLSERSGFRKCIKCQGNFCVNCKVPWHYNITCFEYKRRNPNPLAEDAKLKTLAARNLWRQCVKCNHMIELATGCYHMTCRCGYEFCYTCGAEWKNKKATCSCPLWDDDNIIYSDEDDFDEEDDDDFYDSESDDYY